MPPGIRADNMLMLGPRGHVYLDAHWPGVSARACWDTGAGATVVDRSFWLSHPELFEQIGASVGTDVNGDQAETPLLFMAGPVIGQHTFSRHKVATVDLSQVNRTLEHPMDLILGYPTIRQANSRTKCSQRLPARRQQTPATHEASRASRRARPSGR
jgi:hypothetical protein